MTLRIKTRLTLWHLAILAIIIGAFVGSTYVRLSNQLHAGIDADLRVRADAVRQELRVRPALSLASLKPTRGTEETFVELLDGGGSRIDATTDSPEASFSWSRPAATTLVTVQPPDEGKVRALLIPLADGRMLIVGAPLTGVKEALESYGRTAIVGGLAALLFAGVGGWMMARAALRPVESMRSEAEAIPASEPERRLSLPDRDDEIGRLATTLNEMLSRLEKTIKRERAFVAEASHDLRTPVAIMKSEIELALQKGRSPEELRAALRSAAEEVDRLGTLADDLLTLAEPAKALPARSEGIDLDALVTGSVRRFEALARDNGVRLTVSHTTGATARGDRSRLERALANLIDNALRNTPRGGEVSVRLAIAGRGATIEVADDGTGVPEELRPLLFEPFQRGAAAYPGVGLGLAITKAIARAHGGDVTYEPRPGSGSAFRIELPASQTPQKAGLTAG